MKHTRKQVLSAIKYWRDRLDESLVNYDSFYCKRGKSLYHAVNLNSLKYLAEAISRSELCLKNSYCVFNPYSYLNIVRVNESARKYLDEKNRET